MSEVANSSATAGVERVVGWACAGAGAGMFAGGAAFARFSDSPWPIASGAVLLTLGVGFGFAAFVRDGGLGGDDSTVDDGTWHDEPPRYFAALGSILAFALVFGVMAGVATGTERPVVSAARATESVTLPGFVVTVPTTPTVTREANAYRATLTGWPPGAFSIEWQRDPIDSDELEARLDDEYGRLEGKSALAAGNFRGVLWILRDSSGHTAVVAGACEDGPWITTTVRSESADYAEALARELASTTQCTAEQAATAPGTGTETAPDQTAAVSPVPRFVMPAGFGAVPTADGYAFQSLAGDTLAFRALELREGASLLSGALEAALGGEGVVIEEFAPTRWPEGSARREPVFSFVRVVDEARTSGLATILACPSQRRAYLAVALAGDAAANLARLEPLACPAAGEPAPAYETLLAVAERACNGGDRTACDARTELAAMDDFRVLALP